MEIILKRVTGKSIFLEGVEPNCSVADFINIAFQKKVDAIGKASIEKYSRCILFMFGGKKLDPAKTLADYKILNGATIMEVPDRITMAFNFDWETLSLTLTDPDS